MKFRVSHRVPPVFPNSTHVSHLHNQRRYFTSFIKNLQGQAATQARASSNGGSSSSQGQFLTHFCLNSLRVSFILSTVQKNFLKKLKGESEKLSDFDYIHKLKVTNYQNNNCPYIFFHKKFEFLAIARKCAKKMKFKLPKFVCTLSKSYDMQSFQRMFLCTLLMCLINCITFVFAMFLVHRIITAYETWNNKNGPFDHFYLKW